MQLIEVDAIHSESQERSIARREELFGSTIRLPPTTRTHQSPLGGDDDVASRSTMAAKGPRDQPLVVTDVVLVQRIDVRRVEERHPGVEYRVHDRYRLRFRGPVPQREVHPAVADR